MSNIRQTPVQYKIQIIALIISTFDNKSSNTIILATSNLWSNIQIVRTHILKYNVPNPVSLISRHFDFETLYCYILDNVEDVRKIYFSTQKHVYYSYTLRKIYQYSFFKNPDCSSKLLGLIYSDLLKLLTLYYSKYKWVINNYFSYCNHYDYFFMSYRWLLYGQYVLRFVLLLTHYLLYLVVSSYIISQHLMQQQGLSHISLIYYLKNTICVSYCQ